MAKFTKSDMTNINPVTGIVQLKVDLEGYSEIPNSNDDLFIKAAIALLESVDEKHFIEANKVDLYDELTRKLKVTLESFESY